MWALFKQDFLVAAVFYNKNQFASSKLNEIKQYLLIFLGIFKNRYVLLKSRKTIVSSFEQFPPLNTFRTSSSKKEQLPRQLYEEIRYSLLAMNLVLVLAETIFVFDLHKLHRYIEKFVSLSTSQFKLQVNYKLHSMRDHLARY